MKRLALSAAFLAMLLNGAIADDKIKATLFKNPGCKCCDWYADHLRSNGFDVAVVEHRSMSFIKEKFGVQEKLEGCHSTVIGDYVVEGHVPVTPIKRMLTEKPAIKGISLPGMPQGSPGMSGEKEGPFEILSITGEPGPAPHYATE